jgi:hypothetical protein
VDISSRIRLTQTDPSASDAFVDIWKKAWLAGTEACWTNKPSVNPNSGDPERSAWQAGWSWAQSHPNRRTAQTVRLAHPRRRATDGPRPVVRAIKFGAWGIGGLGVFAASRWAWRVLQRGRNEPAAKPSAPPAD